MRELQRRNINVHLYLVGCKTPEEFTEPFIHSVGFLNKNDVKERNQLKEIYSNMNFYYYPLLQSVRVLYLQRQVGMVFHPSPMILVV